MQDSQLYFSLLVLCDAVRAISVERISSTTVITRLIVDAVNAIESGSALGTRASSPSRACYTAKLRALIDQMSIHRRRVMNISKNIRKGDYEKALPTEHTQGVHSGHSGVAM